MRLDHIVDSAGSVSGERPCIGARVPPARKVRMGRTRGTSVDMSGGHSGEEIPVPIPNTEVKLSNADDTALAAGK